MTQTIGLGMIVKDAAPTIERCIRSALPIIDRACLIDTGSTDDTMEIAKRVLAEANIPSRFLTEKWEGHAHNRSDLLRRTRYDVDYLLQLDADMEVLIHGEIPPLTHDSYNLTILDRGNEYPLPLLTSTRKPFYYNGVAHAYLACKEDTTYGWLRELSLLDHGGGGGRPGKIERDAELLAAQVGKDPSDSRSWFYLAQSYRDLDRVPEAIAAYKMRASLGGWDEEHYYALYQAGVLLCEHVSYAQGSKLLLEAWNLCPNRAEALRALAGTTSSVADKLPFPVDDVLFVNRSAYRTHPLSPDDVSAVLVTRGNVDMQPIINSLPYKDIVVWDNSKRDRDLKVYGRYEAIKEAKNRVIYWQDDDVLFTNHTTLLGMYEPGKVIANMDKDWIDGAGYRGLVTMMGAGSLCDRDLPERVFARYFAAGYEIDDDFLTEADFAFGVIAPSKVIDIGYSTFDYTDDADRLYTQPGQTERKWMMIERARAIRDAV